MGSQAYNHHCHPTLSSMLALVEAVEAFLQSQYYMLEEIARACSDTRIRPSLMLVLTGPNGQIGGLEVTAFY